jgi:hypothetical protein
LAILCASCSNKSRFETIEPKIDIQQARNIALELIKGKYNENVYIKDSISVHESTKDINYWEVWIKKSETVIPPNLLILVNKITGKAEDISDKQE